MSTDLQEEIAAIPFWYHKIVLPGGVTTPGWAPMAPERYQIPRSLLGQRILDVGAWDGYWTFEALKRGAFEVVAIDDFSDVISSLSEKPHPKWKTFDLCAAALEYGPECVSRREMSVYDVSPEALGMFDTVFFFGTLYHLRHPLLALDKLASVCTREIYVETAILDDHSPYRGGIGGGYPGHQMVMEFYPGAEYAQNATNWWVPTLECLGAMVQAAGFKDVKTWKLIDQPSHLSRCRGFAKGTRA